MLLINKLINLMVIIFIIKMEKLLELIIYIYHELNHLFDLTIIFIIK